MIQSLARFRLARLLAFLAVLLTAGIGPHAHVHAANGGKPPGLVVCAEAAAPEGNDVDPSPAGHCGICHAMRALLPGDAVHGATMAALRLSLWPSELPASLPAPDLPARPPRPGTA